MPAERLAMTLASISVFLMVGCTPQQQTAQSQQPAAPPQPTLQQIYEQSIVQAAVKKPDYARKLVPIGANERTVKVAHLQPWNRLDESRFVWVARQEELQAACRGKSDPLLALQQALGLPPEADPERKQKVFLFEVATARLFRPCLADQSITTDRCPFEAPRSNAVSLNASYVLSQVASSYRTDFKTPGYPFTGMGWSYNWSPDSEDHYGISEYVAKPGKPAFTNVSSVTPQAFCAP